VPTVKSVPPELREESTRRVTQGATPAEIRSWLASHGVQVALTTARKIVREARAAPAPPPAPPTAGDVAVSAVPEASAIREAIRSLLSVAADKTIPGTARVAAGKAVLEYEQSAALRLLQAELAELARK
jgi:hypothetical protein